MERTFHGSDICPIPGCSKGVSFGQPRVEFVNHSPETKDVHVRHAFQRLQMCIDCSHGMANTRIIHEHVQVALASSSTTSFIILAESFDVISKHRDTESNGVEFRAGEV